MLLQAKAELEENPLVYKYVLGVISVLLVCFLVIAGSIWLFKLVESIYIDYIARKPLFRHFYLKLNDLTPGQRQILESNFKFYKRLNLKEQGYFRHRLHKFLNNTEFVGKEHLEINDTHRVLVSATAVMLTFGYRDYSIGLVDKILIYPTSFYSNLDKTYHKGHFNPAYRAVILSWEDFMIGYKIEDDNLNLGIHEFIHALHLSYLQTEFQNDVTAYLFLTGLKELQSYINDNPVYKSKLVNSNYFRAYAFENNFEFIAVVVESFIETPQDFKAQFPELYKKVRQMLNFNFKGY